MTTRQQQGPKQQQLWAAAASEDVAQAAAALQALAAGRHTPSHPEQVAQLLTLVQHSQLPGTPPLTLQPAITLLGRWARQQSLQPAAARDTALLRRLVAAGQQLLGAGVVAAASEPRLAAACLMLLGSCAASLPADAVEGIAEAVGSALLGEQLGIPEPASAADAIAAVGGLLPSLLGQPAAATWVLAALLHWLGGCAAQHPSCLALECLAPAYSLMRGVATTTLGRTQSAAAVAGLLRPAYAVLQAAAAQAGEPGAASEPPELQQPPWQAPAQAAAAVLALGGLAEGLLRSAAGFPQAAQLAAEAECSLLAACSSVAAACLAAAAAPGAADAGLALLRDACALAAAQLAAGVRRPQLPDTAAAGVARCQAQSLLHSVLSLAPLCQAADRLLPPAEASLLLQRLAGCALAQHSSSMVRSLAEQYRLLDRGTQQWLVRELQAAARQAYQQYRQYSLTAPPGWLAAVDGLAVRQLLDRLFLSCLVLLAAVWEAGPVASAAPAAAAGQRAQQATDVAGVLADIQFCRLASPQYAALLKPVLAEVPGDAAAAASLAGCLLCYAELVASCPARGGQAAWLVDGVAAAKVQFLMNALVPCCGRLTQVVLEERLAPTAFLYLLHAHTPTATAAHQLFCALLLAVPSEQQREPLAAYYVRRSLEGCPGATPLPAFGQGLATLLQALPVGSPVALLCLKRVLEKYRELADRGDPGIQQLAALAAQQLLLVDHMLLDDALAAFDALLWAAPTARPPTTAANSGPPGAAAVLHREVLAAVRHTDDSLRKPVLARWLIGSGAAGGGGAAPSRGGGT